MILFRKHKPRMFTSKTERDVFHSAFVCQKAVVINRTSLTFAEENLNVIILTFQVIFNTV